MVSIKRASRTGALLLAFATACTGASLPDTEVSRIGGIETGQSAPGEQIGFDPNPESTDALDPGVKNPTTSGTGGKTPGDQPVGPGVVTPPPLPPGEKPSDIFTPAEEKVGLSPTEIRMCVHAALTYGAAFNTGEADLNVYWQYVNEELGGIYGRKVNMRYINDNYSPDTAVQAATQCKSDHNPFVQLGGIGFDQIPAVRNWAEQNRMLYIHHTATVEGSQSLKYSYSGKPTTEKMGEMFAELALLRASGKKIGIIKRASQNWEPGVAAFKKFANGRLNIVYEREVAVNQGNYINEISELRGKGAELVWVWLNALETTEFVKQARAQTFAPQFMVFPFNLESQTLGNDALNPSMIGVGMYQAYSHADDSGPFQKYIDDIREFKRQYAKFRPSADLDGVGGDLIFLAWADWKAMHGLLLSCGPNCTRDKLIDVMRASNNPVTSSYCPIDFTRAGSRQHGGHRVSVMETYRAPDNNVNWRNTHYCVEHLI